MEENISILPPADLQKLTEPIQPEKTPLKEEIKVNQQLRNFRASYSGDKTSNFRVTKNRAKTVFREEDSQNVQEKQNDKSKSEEKPALEYAKQCASDLFSLLVRDALVCSRGGSLTVKRQHF